MQYDVCNVNVILDFFLVPDPDTPSFYLTSYRQEMAQIAERFSLVLLPLRPTYLLIEYNFVVLIDIDTS